MVSLTLALLLTQVPPPAPLAPPPSDVPPAELAPPTLALPQASPQLAQRLRLVPEDPAQGSFRTSEFVAGLGGWILGYVATAGLGYASFKLLAPSADTELSGSGFTAEGSSNDASSVVPFAVTLIGFFVLPPLGSALAARAVVQSPFSGSTLRAFLYAVVGSFTVLIGEALVLTAAGVSGTSPSAWVATGGVVAGTALLASYGLHDGPIHWKQVPVDAPLAIHF